MEKVAGHDWREGRVSGMAWVGDSKFWVVSGYGTDSQEHFRSNVEFYDPNTRSQSKVDKVLSFSRIRPKGAADAVNINRNEYQWCWFLRGDQQLQQRLSGKEVKENEKMIWEIVNSIPLSECMSGENPCVIRPREGAKGVKKNDKNNNKPRIFMVSDRGSSCSSLMSCSECDRRVFILERDCNNRNTKWNHIQSHRIF